MPTRRTFYEPFVQAAEPTGGGGVAGIVVDQPGLYLLVDDVVATLRAMADEAEFASEPFGRAALQDAAERFEQHKIVDA